MAQGVKVAIKFDFDPIKATGIKVAKEDRADALDEVATFVKESILSNCSDGKTSVKGGKWKRTLSPGYKKAKSEESSNLIADMELTGEMLDALETYVDGRRVAIEISGEQEGKAEGNLLGSYGRSPDPSKAREFMPHRKNQELAPEIMRGVTQILKRYEDKE